MLAPSFPGLFLLEYMKRDKYSRSLPEYTRSKLMAHLPSPRLSLSLEYISPALVSRINYI